MSRVTVSTVGLPGLEANDNAVVSPPKVILPEVWLCAEKSPHPEERPASRGVTPALYRVSKDGNDSTFVGKTLAADQTPPCERGRTAAAGRLAATVAQRRRTLRPARALPAREAARSPAALSEPGIRTRWPNSPTFAAPSRDHFPKKVVGMAVFSSTDPQTPAICRARVACRVSPLRARLARNTAT